MLVHLPGDLAFAAGDFLGDFPLGDLGLAGDLGETALGEAFLAGDLDVLGVEGATFSSSSLTGADRRFNLLIDFFKGVFDGTRGLPNGVLCSIKKICTACHILTKPHKDS